MGAGSSALALIFSNTKFDSKKHLAFASAEFVGWWPADGSALVRGFELHADDEEHPKMCVDYSNGMQVEIADAAKGSPQLLYRVPARWVIPAQPYPYSNLLQHHNWVECHTCWHGGKPMAAFKGARISCAKCPRTFHRNPKCLLSELPAAPTEGWRCVFCTRYDRETVISNFGSTNRAHNSDQAGAASANQRGMEVEHTEPPSDAPTALVSASALSTSAVLGSSEVRRRELPFKRKALQSADSKQQHSATVLREDASDSTETQWTPSEVHRFVDWVNTFVIKFSKARRPLRVKATRTDATRLQEAMSTDRAVRQELQTSVEEIIGSVFTRLPPTSPVSLYASTRYDPDEWNLTMDLQLCVAAARINPSGGPTKNWRPEHWAYVGLFPNPPQFWHICKQRWEHTTSKCSQPSGRGRYAAHGESAPRADGSYFIPPVGDIEKASDTSQ